jgi:sialate O-acetylesterase
MKTYFELAPIFTDNVVFQADKPIKIFGKCKKNIEMTFKLLDNEFCIRTKEENFLIEFPPMEMREQAFSITISTRKQIETLYNCLIGDVYLFFGGMNISMPLNDSYHNQDYDNLNLRFFSSNGISSNWEISGKENFESFSAIAYLFAKGMHEIIKTPIGIINCTHKESRIFSWMSISDIESNREINLLTSKFSIDEKIPLYSWMKEKIIPFAVKMLVFYQGENDYPYHSVYENALKSVIKCLRFDFKDLKLPFFVIQIAGYNHPETDDFSVSLVRIAQANVANEKDEVYLVSAIDFGDPEEINPKDKHLVAKRLANLVLEKIFKIGKNNESPRYFSHQIFPDSIIIMTQGNYLYLTSKSNQYLGFYYSENGVDFLPLNGVIIRNNQIIVPRNEAMVEVRYAMRKYPACDIISANNLPLLPFRIKI